MLSATRDRPVALARVATLVEANRGVFLQTTWPVLPLRPLAASRLATVGAPTLVVVGGRDTPFSRAHARAACEGIPDAIMRTIPEAGHLASLDEPEAFDRFLTSFLLRDSGRPAAPRCE